MMYRAAAGGTNSQTQVLLPQGYQLSGAQIYQVYAVVTIATFFFFSLLRRRVCFMFFVFLSQQNQNTKSQSQQQGLAAAKLLNQPSISITPLPRQTSTQASTSNNTTTGNLKPGKPVNNPSGKGTFVVCEICDGYIKVN